MCVWRKCVDEEYVDEVAVVVDDDKEKGNSEFVQVDSESEEEESVDDAGEGGGVNERGEMGTVDA
jgi:hypothetical protein